MAIKIRPRKLKMHAESFYIPKDNPSKPRGEDAHFISDDAQVVAVADGVGGWSRKGIDTGEYARELMRNAADIVRNHRNIDPKRVLEEAFSKTVSPGSSTACIVTLAGNLLRAANVGDNGFLIIRNDAVLYTSPTQQRSFNCPYQLGTMKDDPSVADEIEVRVEKGDIVVVGTDGLFDNVHAWEILEILRLDSVRGRDLMEQCCYMANMALYDSFDKYRDTPYSMVSRRAGKCHRGGKVDDITVIIGRIED